VPAPSPSPRDTLASALGHGARARYCAQIRRGAETTDDAPVQKFTRICLYFILPPASPLLFY